MNPYKTLSSDKFWKLAVAERSLFDIESLWSPKFPITKEDKISTFGSCFAQHIGKALRNNGYNWYITETGPKDISEATAKKYNYNVFSVRTGNIYTTTLLKQLVSWSLKGEPAPDEAWEKSDRYIDPFRPAIEPNGFATKEEMLRSRNKMIHSFKECLTKSDVFVFTLGLTESWSHKSKGHEYPMCPGTIGGEFSPEDHLFINQTYEQVKQGLMESINIIRLHNPNIKFILTVSPVPLTATKSENHVLVATIESKSVLRAVAGAVSRELSFVDYFPSYEIISAPPFKGVFFEPNMRSINPAGVRFVMDAFFRPARNYNTNSKTVAQSAEQKTESDVVCEEELLQAFSSTKQAETV